MDKFFSLVSTIDDFEKNLDQISLFGRTTVGDYITGQLNNFIKKKLDKLPSVHDLIMVDDLDTSLKKLTSVCGNYEKDPENFVQATSAILSTRMYNYAILNQKDFKKDHIRKFADLINHTSFTTDQKYFMVKQTVKCGNNFTSILASDPRFTAHMIS